jgi:hypothetical protein
MRFDSEREIQAMLYPNPNGFWSRKAVVFSIEEASGELVTMERAERGTRLRNGLWVRELRKRGHETAILCTDYRSQTAPRAMAMFARWSQENFFKHARGHLSLDHLVDYRTEVISDPTPGQSTPTIATWTDQCARPPASAPGAWPSSPS